MYLNTPKDEQHDQGRNENERLSQLMIDLATELKERTEKPWTYAPGVGLCIDAGGMRITFIKTEALRDRGRHNLKIEMFDRLSLLQTYEEFKKYDPWPQVKLSKSAKAIANQLETAGVINDMIAHRKALDNVEDRFRRDALAATAGAKFIALGLGWLRTTPASGRYIQAEILGTIGETIEIGYKAETLYRNTALVNIHLANVPLKTARRIAELIEQDATAADIAAEAEAEAEE
jgi:hypothetical protein